MGRQSSLMKATLSDVALELGVTKARAHQIEKAALRKVADGLRARGFFVASAAVWEPGYRPAPSRGDDAGFIADSEGYDDADV